MFGELYYDIVGQRELLGGLSPQPDIHYYTRPTLKLPCTCFILRFTSITSRSLFSRLTAPMLRGWRCGLQFCARSCHNGIISKIVLLTLFVPLSACAAACCYWSGTAGYLSFGPMAQCVVHALKGLACRARVTPAGSPASHCKQCSALTSPALHARGCASPSRAR